MANSELKLLVISDLHCKYNSTGQDSSTRLLSNLLPVPKIQHPIEALKHVIDEDKIKADIILCPGDIADKSDKQGYLSGYKFLKEIKDHIKANYLISTVGNHDVDSYQLFEKTFDHIPRHLDKTFPFNDESIIEKFWTNNFCLVVKEEFAVLVFNSAHTHNSKVNARKSAIDIGTVEKIEEALKKLPSSVRFKIALCHHHPWKHYNLNYPDDDVIDKGDLLLKLLEAHNFQILVHGHKHEPAIGYFNSLPILCSGSFSSLENIRELGADNVFHLITLNENSKYGSIKSYKYGVHNGWHVQNGAYFPCFTGFGYRSDLKDLAKKCKEFILNENQSMVSYDDTLKIIPEINFLIPRDQKEFNREIESLGLVFTPPFPDRPTYLIIKAQ